MNEFYLIQDGILLALINDNDLNITQALIEISILKSSYLSVISRNQNAKTN